MMDTIPILKLVLARAQAYMDELQARELALSLGDAAKIARANERCARAARELAGARKALEDVLAGQC